MSILLLLFGACCALAYSSNTPSFAALDDDPFAVMLHDDPEMHYLSHFQLHFTCFSTNAGTRQYISGEITILSGNEDMICIKTSVQAKEAIIKNAAALEPIQDGDQYTYTIHTPLEEKLEKAVTFQVFITIPRHLDSLESFTIEGTNVELAIGNISHTFIRKLNITNMRGDISIDSFYGEYATINSTVAGGIRGRYSVARLFATTKAGRINADVHLLNTDDQLPSPKVICSANNFRVDLNVDGSDLFGPFTVEAKTQCSPMDVKILLASSNQKLLGNFINFGGPLRVRMSGNFQGRVETRTHYGKIHLDEPKFVKLEGAVLTIPSLSDRSVPTLIAHSQSSSVSQMPDDATLPLSGMSHQSNVISSRTSSQETAMSWGDDHHPHLHHEPHQREHSKHANYSLTPRQRRLPSTPESIHGSESNSKAESTTGSFSDSRSVTGYTRTDKQRKKEEKDSIITREVIGTIGDGAGLIMVKNSSGDIIVELI
ncbi:hypothetical protein EDD11_010454 [Mortierella claussenii]|nr:hypothetical protein EDD11_010454 [Mortierella claussenii]